MVEALSRRQQRWAIGLGVLLYLVVALQVPWLLP